MAAAAKRAYRNRHLDTLMLACAAKKKKQVGQCFGQCSFECVIFHGLGQLIASLTRESIAERASAIHSFPSTQTEKDNAFAKCKFSHRA